MGGPGAGTGAAVSTTKRRGNSEGSNPMQRADGRWQILIRHTDEDGVSRRYTVNGITAKDARDRAGEIKKRLLANLPARDRKVTLGSSPANGSSRPSRLQIARRPPRRCTPRSRASTSSVPRSARSRSTSSGRPTSTRGRSSCRVAGSPQSTIRTAYTILRAVLDTRRTGQSDSAESGPRRCGVRR